MKVFIFSIVSILYLSNRLSAQVDSLKNNFKSELSIGIPLFPPIMKFVGSTNYNPVLETGVVPLNEYYYPTIDINYKYQIKPSKKNKAGIIYSKMENDFYFLLNLGQEYKLGRKFNKRFKVFLGYDLSFGYTEFYSLGITGGRLYKFGRILSGGIDGNIAFHYDISKKLFFESETSLLFYYSNATWAQLGYNPHYNYDYINLQSVSFFWTTFPKILGLNIGYKF